MLSFNEQGELLDFLEQKGFDLVKSDALHLDFILRRNGVKIEIRIIKNLLRPFISIKVNGNSDLMKMPDSFKSLKGLLREYLDRKLVEI